MKRKKKYEDDGRTISDMNCEGFSWYVSPEEAEKRKDIEKLSLTKKERRTLIRQAFLDVLPMVVVIVIALFAAMLLITLWLN